MRSVTLLAFAVLLAADSLAQPLASPNPSPYSVSRPDYASTTRNASAGRFSPVTFVKKLGAQQRREIVFSMCASADGNIYLAGKQDDNPMIAKITTLGEPVWVRNFPPVNPNEPIEWSSIIEDSDSMIVLCGTEGASPANRRAIVMRYDPAAGTVLWYKRIAANKPVGINIVEISPGGNFVLQTNYQKLVNGSISAQTEFFTINRADGNTVGSSVGYQPLNDNIVLAGAVMKNGNLYTVGSWSVKATGEVQPFFAKMPPGTYIPEWAYLQIPDTTTGAAGRMSAVDLAFDGDNPIIAGSGHLNPSAPSEQYFVYLQKQHPDGSPAWIKRYDMAMVPGEVLVVDGAYVVFGHLVGSNQVGMLKTDTDGNVLQARVLTIAPPSPVSVGFAARQNLALRLPAHLLMIDHTWELNESDIVLLRTDLNLELEGICPSFQNLAVSSQTLSATIVPASFGIETNTPAGIATNASAVLMEDSLPLRQECPTVVDPVCTDKPDLIFRIETIGCDSTAFVTYRLCNSGKVSFAGTLNVGVYDANPLISGAGLLDFFELPVDNLPPDSCQTGTLSNLFYWGPYNNVYTLAGIENGLSTPIDSAGFPYNGIAECDYANNLDSIDVHYPPPPPKPELGPDRVVCAGDTIILDAGTGFVAYDWSNGPNTTAVPVTATGLYIVNVTDACGRIQSDTVVVTVLPQPTPGSQTIEFYPGDTITIGGQPYTQSDTLTLTLSTADGCDSMVTYFLHRIVTNIDLLCPADLQVVIPAGQSSVPVSYAVPAAATDCPDAGIVLTRLQGPPSGGAFAQGTTQVCYEAANHCGIRDTCCFNVTAQQAVVEEACDVKMPSGSCIRFELLSIRLDAQGNPRYRMRLTNICSSAVKFAWFQLPDGITALAPAQGAVYLSPAGGSYEVRNPQLGPFRSIRYLAPAGNLKNGASDIFEYTLPKQAQPLFIRALVKLEDGTSVETHLNTFSCPVQPYAPPVAPSKPAAQNREDAPAPAAVFLQPNPTTGLLHLYLQNVPAETAQLSVLNVQGQIVLEGQYAIGNGRIVVHLPGSLTNGLYFLRMQPEGGGPVSARFVLER